MIGELLTNIIRFVLLIFLQLFVLNNIQFSGFVNPYFYVLFVLLLPFEISGWLMLVLAFILGMMIDVASATIGYHTVATVFLAYFRYHLLRFIAPRDGYEPGISPAINSLGFQWFFKYVSILTVSHHFILFWVESFQIGDLLSASLRALASSTFTLLLIFIYEFLTVRSK